MSALLFSALLAPVFSDNASCPSTGGLGLLQKSPSLQRLILEVEAAQEREWVAVDGGIDRACRGKSAGDNLASYFTVNTGLASLSACQALCENTAECKGVEYHISGRCEIWTRPGGIEASISLSDYSCYALELSDFIPALSSPAIAVKFGHIQSFPGQLHRVLSASSIMAET
eukprot:Skav228504  [mRNA]  locus=scaffold1092:402232:405142:- [translate_table: standard]